MLIKQNAPPNSKQEADALRERPSPEKFAPDSLSHWSITMTVAWIIWRETDAVRNEWDNYRSECADWVFESNPRALALRQAVAHDNAERVLDEFAERASDARLPPIDPVLQEKIQKKLEEFKDGSWHWYPWKPSSWRRLSLAAHSQNKSPQVAKDELWRAAGESRIKATAREYKNVKALIGDPVEIPAHYWPHLKCADDALTGKPMLSDDNGRAYREVQFARLDVKALWSVSEVLPEDDLQPQMIAEQVSKQESDPGSETKSSPPEQPETRRPLTGAEIEPEFKRWRERQPAGFIPTADDDFEHMRKFDVTRDTVRELRTQYPRRSRGQKKKPHERLMSADNPRNIRG